MATPRADVEGQLVCVCAESQRLQKEGLERQVADLQRRLARLEERDRGRNLVFHGLCPGGRGTGAECSQRALQLIEGTLGVRLEAGLERASRLGRAVLVTFLSVGDRARVLGAVGRLRGSGVTAREDLSPGARRRQRGLLPVFRQLRAQGRPSRLHRDTLTTEHGTFTFDLSLGTVVRLAGPGLTGQGMGRSGHVQREAGGDISLDLPRLAGRPAIKPRTSLMPGSLDKGRDVGTATGQGPGRCHTEEKRTTTGPGEGPGAGLGEGQGEGPGAGLGEVPGEVGTESWFAADETSADSDFGTMTSDLCTLTSSLLSPNDSTRVWGLAPPWEDPPGHSGTERGDGNPPGQGGTERGGEAGCHTTSGLDVSYCGSDRLEWEENSAGNMESNGSNSIIEVRDSYLRSTKLDDSRSETSEFDSSQVHSKTNDSGESYSTTIELDRSHRRTFEPEDTPPASAQADDADQSADEYSNFCSDILTDKASTGLFDTAAFGLGNGGEGQGWRHRGADDGRGEGQAPGDVVHNAPDNQAEEEGAGGSRSRLPAPRDEGGADGSRQRGDCGDWRREEQGPQADTPRQRRLPKEYTAQQDVARTPRQKDGGGGVVTHLTTGPPSTGRSHGPHVTREYVIYDHVTQDFVPHTPTRGDVMHPPGRDDVTHTSKIENFTQAYVNHTPRKDIIMRTPRRDDVTRTSRRDDVTPTPRRDDVTRTPRRDDVTSTPRRDDVTRTLRRDDVTPSPRRRRGQDGEADGGGGRGRPGGGGRGSTCSLALSCLSSLTPSSTTDGERDVGWHRSGGQWRYSHRRTMADTGQHPANQGAPPPPSPPPPLLNGQAAGSGDGNDQEEDHISRKLCEMQDSILLPIKEDLSEWVGRLTGVEITPDTFLDVLDSGVVLCSIATIIQQHAHDMAKQGKLSEPLPSYKLHCNKLAKSGTWFSRDNATNFLGWCRAYGMSDETMFDSEDLVAHKQEKPVVNCVLELARIGWRYGVEPPNLIRMEREIETQQQQLAPPPFLPKPVEMVNEKPPPPPPEVKKPDKMDLHKEVKRVAHKCKCQEYVNRISEGVYDVFGKRIFIRLLHGRHLMVRVGGGWDTFENYLLHHVPLQVYQFHRDPSTRPAPGFDGYLVIKSKYKS